jgi:hypothetical protein
MKIILASVLAVGLLSGGCASTDAAYQRGLSTGFLRAETEAVHTRRQQRFIVQAQEAASLKQFILDQKMASASTVLDAEGADWRDGWALRGNYETSKAALREDFLGGLQDDAADHEIGLFLAGAITDLNAMADREQQSTRRIAKALTTEAVTMGLSLWREIEEKSKPLPPPSDGGSNGNGGSDGPTQEQLDYWNEHGYPGK